MSSGERATVIGDFDQDGVLGVADIEILSDVVRKRTNDSTFDLTMGGIVDAEDRRDWVRELKQTWFGDANLDGEFNNADLVRAFTVGQYEDNVPLNSDWETGDWNGDAEFDTSDLVMAFQVGGFERGKRQVNAVPAPSAVLMLAVGFLVMSLRLKTAAASSG